LILDSSAIVAIICGEKGSERLVAAVETAPHLGIGAPTATESAIVLVRRFGVAGRLMLARFLEQNDVISISFGNHHLSVAAEAFIRYGKGRHPARLNYGDCMTYATAKIADVPLLFTGDDFAKTDLTPAVA
jgi:ribonuclease VapC